MPSPLLSKRAWHISIASDDASLAIMHSFPKVKVGKHSSFPLYRSAECHSSCKGLGKTAKEAIFNLQ